MHSTARACLPAAYRWPATRAASWCSTGERHLLHQTRALPNRDDQCWSQKAPPAAHRPATQQRSFSDTYCSPTAHHRRLSARKDTDPLERKGTDPTLLHYCTHLPCGRQVWRRETRNEAQSRSLAWVWQFTVTAWLNAVNGQGLQGLAERDGVNNVKPGLKRALRWTSSLLVAAVVSATFTQRAAAGDDDPPDRVARLSYLRGSVSFQPAGEEDWVPAVVNRPMTTADRLWTDDGGRAEMQLGSATIRVSDRTGMSFLNLDDRGTQIELAEGTINIRVRRLGRDESVEIDTPNQAFSILRPGQYRIEVSEDGDSTMVTVRAGEGEASGSERIYRLVSGESANFTGTTSLRARISRAGGYDEFDRWCQDRDRRDDRSRSVRYVSPNVVGYEDLDDYGSWYSDADYGYIWRPRVARGWAPYHDGHWVWISPWGWTWVDEAPWGYAPFHYGRWVYARNYWGWVPGPIAVRPVYAPALVVFIGGPQFSLSVAGGSGYGGNVGWFPLGPREVYVPAYRYQPRVREPCQCQQHDGDQHHDHQRLQQQQQHEHPVHEQDRARRSDRGAAKHVCECAAGGSSGRRRERAGDRIGADNSPRRGRANQKQCSGSVCPKQRPCGAAVGSGVQPLGCGQDSAATAASAFRKTTRKTCGAAWPAVGRKRDRGIASRECSGRSIKRQASVSRQGSVDRREPTGKPAA